VCLGRAALLGLLITLVATLRGDLPITRDGGLGGGRSAVDWQRTRARWERFFAVRTVAATAAFGCVVIAVLVPGQSAPHGGGSLEMTVAATSRDNWHCAAVGGPNTRRASQLPVLADRRSTDDCDIVYVRYRHGYLRHAGRYVYVRPPIRASSPFEADRGLTHSKKRSTAGRWNPSAYGSLPQEQPQPP